MKLPFRFKYWVVLKYGGDIISVRARTNWGRFLTEPLDTLLDGPFDFQEDAVRALNFWRLQYGNQRPVKKRRGID